MTRVRWWGPGVVALVLLVLCGGLPLVNTALGSGGRPLEPGTVLSAGTPKGGVRPVTFVIPAAGWMLSTAETSLTGNVKVFSGDVAVNLNVVVPLGPLDARRLWNGLGRIVEAGGQHRLGAAPAPIPTPDGLSGLSGTISGRDRAGTAAVFATATLGATLTAAGPPRAYAEAAADVEAMVRTVRIRSPWP